MTVLLVAGLAAGAFLVMLAFGLAAAAAREQLPPEDNVIPLPEKSA